MSKECAYSGGSLSTHLCGCGATSHPLRRPGKAIYAVLVVLINASGISAGLAAVHAPLPLDVVSAVDVIIDHAISPDGRWLAYTHMDSAQRLHTIVAQLDANHLIYIGSADESTWAPVWSPNSQHLAFYASHDGAASVVLWSATKKITHRLAGVTPASDAPGVSWAADGSGFAVLLKPAAVVNSQDGSSPAAGPVTAQSAPAAVVVFRSDAPRERRYSSDPSKSSVPMTSATDNRCDEGSQLQCRDLAFVDVVSENVQRVVERQPITWYALSPNGAQVAYTVHKGWAPATQQPRHDLFLARVQVKGLSMQVAHDEYLHNGEAVRWSPDGRRIAFMSHNPGGKPTLTTVVVANGETNSVTDERIRSFNSGLDEVEPILLWAAQGKHIYTLHTEEGSLWRMDVPSGQVSSVRVVRNRRIIGAAGINDPSHRDGTVAVVTEALDKSRSGIYKVDSKSRNARRVFERPWSISSKLSVSTAGTISLMASDQRYPPRVWLLRNKDRQPVVAAAAHNEVSGYALGTAQVIAWHTADGHTTGGALLLPPSYESGRRLPLVVWVYGGDRGSEYVNQFGLAPGNAPVFNLQMLATRGYAVLFPDTPLDVGEPMKELQTTVMRAIDAVVERGYADADRVAVMGQSYGSYCAMSLIAHSTRFKAAVLTGAMSPDLMRMYLHMEPDGISSEGYFERGQGRMGGTPWEYPQRYIDESPIYRFNRVETPVLIGKGDLDGPLGFSDSAFVALRRLGKEVEYRIYRNEGHVISKKVNVVDFWQRRLEFLADNLKLSSSASGVVSARD